jgi:hypothetical protein
VSRAGAAAATAAAAHCKSSMFGASVSIPITKGRLNLGTWQVRCTLLGNPQAVGQLHTYHNHSKQL